MQFKDKYEVGLSKPLVIQSQEQVEKEKYGEEYLLAKELGLERQMMIIKLEKELNVSYISRANIRSVFKYYNKEASCYKLSEYYECLSLEILKKIKAYKDKFDKLWIISDISGYFSYPYLIGEIKFKNDFNVYFWNRDSLLFRLCKREDW